MNQLSEITEQCGHFDMCVDMSKKMKSIDSCLKSLIPMILKEIRSKRSSHDTQKEQPIFTDEEFMNSH